MTLRVSSMFVLFSPGVRDLLLQRVTGIRNLLPEIPPVQAPDVHLEASTGNERVCAVLLQRVRRPGDRQADTRPRTHQFFAVHNQDR